MAPPETARTRSGMNSTSTNEANGNDGLRTCIICADEVPISNGILCDAGCDGHFCCDECVSQHVKTEIEKGDFYMRNQRGKIFCPYKQLFSLFNSYSCTFEYTPDHIRKHCNDEAFIVFFGYIRRKAHKEGADSVISALDSPPIQIQEIPGIHGYKPCPSCGFAIQFRRGHGCHHVNDNNGCMNCGTKWCFSCGQKSGGEEDADCECGLYCDENCDCLPCEDCALLDRPCVYCDPWRCPVCSTRPDHDSSTNSSSPDHDSSTNSSPDHDSSTSNETLTSSVNSQTVPSTSSLEEETDAITQYDIDTLKRKFKRRELLEKCKSLNIKGVSNKNKHQIAARLSEYIEALKDDASAMNFLDLVLDNMRRVDLLEVIQNCPKIDQRGIASKNRQELVDIIRDNTSATLFVLRQNVNPIDLSRIETIFTRADLLKQCKALNIRGVSNKTKAEIIARIQEYQEALLGNDWEGEFLTLLLKNMTKPEMIEVLEQCSDINIKGLGSKNRDELLKLVQGNPKASLRIVRQNVDPIIPN